MSEMPPQRIVKAARTLLNWTQLDLAEKAGVALSTISRFEAGASLNPENYRAVIEVLNEAGIGFTTKHGKVVGLLFPQESKS